MNAAIAAHPGAPVDLATLPAPAWDELWMFAPYVDRAAACEAMRQGRIDCLRELPGQVDEGSMALVFRRAGRITGIAWRSQNSGSPPFIESGAGAPPQPVPHARARFSTNTGELAYLP